MDATPKPKKFIGAGHSTNHDSAARHVAGSATYIDDIREPEGTVHLAPGYAAKAACGRIAKCDLQAVRNYPGVVTVLTAADIPGVNDCSPGAGDDPVLAQTHITFHGQPIFCVVAETRLAARRAARLAIIEIEAEKPNVTVEDALAANKDVLPSYQFKRGDAAKSPVGREFES